MLARRPTQEPPCEHACRLTAAFIIKNVARMLFIDCPQNVTISNTSETNTFLCSADASPPVSVYRWTNNGVQVDNSSTYTVPSGVNYSISCTVTNYLYNVTKNPCNGTASISGVAASKLLH